MTERAGVQGWWLGVDIGGTRTKLGVVNADGDVRRSEVLATTHEPFDVIWERLLDYAREARNAEGAAGLRGIGIAAPGIV